MDEELNLEATYGWLLDGIEQYVEDNEEDFLAHFGVKGQKWGVRKDRANNLKGIGPDTIERTTKTGDTITLTKRPPASIHRGLAFASKKYADAYNNGAFFDIKDSSGNKVGDGNVHLRNNDELYLNWIGIKNSARGNGYASAALNAAQEFGAKQGVKKLTLEVPGNAPDARHIYEKIGFKVVKEATDIDPVWGGLTSMQYDFPSAKHDSLIDIGADVIKHFGVKGQKWGVRKDRAPANMSADASRHAANRGKRVHELSDAELRDLVGRINMEQQVGRLNPGKVQKGHDKAKMILAIGATANTAVAFAKSPTGKAIGSGIADSLFKVGSLANIPVSSIGKTL